MNIFLNPILKLRCYKFYFTGSEYSFGAVTTIAVFAGGDCLLKSQKFGQNRNFLGRTNFLFIEKEH